MAVNALDRIALAKNRAYVWRVETSLVKKLVLAFTMAAIIGLMAQARIVLPWTPVPITLQTLGVLLSGVLLGRNWALITIVIYLALGTAGLPWFTGWGSGTAHLAGPTGGYLIGFGLAALFVGHFTDKFVKARRFSALFGLMTIASLILIYVPGVIWLKLALGSVTWGEALNMGAWPFIAGDMVKVLLASGLGFALSTRQPFSNETDGS